MLIAGFLIAAGYVSYTDDVPLTAAARFVGRKIVLLAIEAGVRVYDPCKPRLAELGPGSEETDPPPGALRAEEYFRALGERDTNGEGRLRAGKIENETIRRSPFRFYYQPHDEPRLHELRRRYRLDEVVAGASDELEQMVRIRRWCRSQFRRKDYQPHTIDFDALEVLDGNLRNDSDRPINLPVDFDPCQFFPLLYCQVMVSMGHTARFVTIGHGMTEVWSNQYKKWVSMDAEMNWHYVKDGVPLNMMELRDENFAPKPTRVRIVRANQSAGDENTTMAHLKVKEIPVEAMLKYHLLDLAIVDMRNDWMTNHYFSGHPRQSDADGLAFEDPRVGPAKVLWSRHRPHTANREDMYWTLNQTEIWVRDSSSADRLELVLRTVTPNLDFFEVRVDGGRPIQSRGGSFAWTLHDGDNSLSVATVNKFGARGIASTVQLARDRPAAQTTAAGSRGP